MQLLSLILLTFIMLVACPRTSVAVDIEKIDDLMVGYGLKDLPDNPSLAQQIDAGHREIEVWRQIDPDLDADRDVVEYLSAIKSRLLAASDQKPPYAIQVHTSRWPLGNANALPGGQILVYENLFDDLSDESQLAEVLAHEIGHELINDFPPLWHDYKTNRRFYGPDGVIWELEKMESAADAVGIRLMYEAGWDPQGAIDDHLMEYKRGVMERRGEPEFRSDHPRERERLAAIKEAVARLAPKEGLIRDTEAFQEIKRKCEALPRHDPGA